MARGVYVGAGGSATATANVSANGGAGSATAQAVGGASAIAALVSCELSGASTATLSLAQYCVRLNSQAKICNNAVPCNTTTTNWSVGQVTTPKRSVSTTAKNLTYLPGAGSYLTYYFEILGPSAA